VNGSDVRREKARVGVVIAESQGLQLSPGAQEVEERFGVGCSGRRASKDAVTVITPVSGGIEVGRLDRESAEGGEELPSHLWRGSKVNDGREGNERNDDEPCRSEQHAASSHRSRSAWTSVHQLPALACLQLCHPAKPTNPDSKGQRF
jgi:hypothetical protein